ncbi:thiamine diphosphokinase [Weissella paramesenteroides]|uniref:Thiamine diphosphokinase n=1 Tax=Weissella paramesenteroides TaxID=1249 RepID=A0ABD4XJ25_WEIPA|nr:thiamine diphosphokinase [Weissella paramesenteroides]MDF8369241.1 thiamine diphosphokinase [Weissella paramesenteroides]MDF8371254.1 thiamine diphosphokinase [Weissella paramesenteroides]
MNRMRLLVGGPMSEWPDDLKNGLLDGPWAAADRGSLRLLHLGQVPVLTVGDFDSVTFEERQEIVGQLPKIVSVKPEKDDTDTELLLSLVEKNYHPDKIEIYGATGGRIDQLLSNIWIFTQPRFTSIVEKVAIIDRYNRIDFFLPGEHTIIKEPTMKYLGFMPLIPVSGLSLLDEKYRLDDWSGNPFSFSSNEFLGEVNHFSFKSGIVAVIQSRDLIGQTADQ